jgi:hypothetical protein
MASDPFSQDKYTNRGAYLFQLLKFQNAWRNSAGTLRAVPTNYHYHLCHNFPALTKKTNTLSQLTHLSGGGYPNNGYPIPLSAVGFPVVTEDDVIARSFSSIFDVSVTAVGGPIGPIGYVVLTDDDPQVSNRQVLFAFELLSEVTIPDGFTKILRSGLLQDFPG